MNLTRFLDLIKKGLVITNIEEENISHHDGKLYGLRKAFKEMRIWDEGVEPTAFFENEYSSGSNYGNGPYTKDVWIFNIIQNPLWNQTIRDYKQGLVVSMMKSIDWGEIYKDYLPDHLTVRIETIPGDSAMVIVVIDIENEQPKEL